MIRRDRDDEQVDFHVVNDVLLTPPAWDDLVPSDHFLLRDQLIHNQSIPLPDVQHWYAWSFRKSKVVAICYFQTLRIKASFLDHARIKPALFRFWQLIVGLFQPQILIGGHLFRQGIESSRFADDLSATESFNCYHVAIRQLIARTGAHAVLLKDIRTTWVSMFAQFAPEYMMQHQDVSMVMDIPAAWHRIEDYEKALKHKYAQRYRKIRHAGTTLRLSEIDVETAKQHQQAIFNLYAQVWQRQPVRLGMISPTYLPYLKQHFKNDFRIWMVYESEEPVAFISAWMSQDAFDMYYIGLDYSRNDRLSLYFNLLFHIVDQAIASSKSKLILGRTALDAKARLGCKPEYLYTAIYIRNGFLRRLTRQLEKQVALPNVSWGDKHPFK